MNRSAFTLVELSIVLVILGLLVGGVLAGQSLIRSAELRSITTEKTNYVVALNAFKEKYFGLPGDLPNAFQFWGAGCGTNATTSSTGCNGDGNGNIDNSLGENVKAWEHLSLAGLIEGSFNGTGTVNSGFVTITTTNIPASKFTSGFWNIGTSPSELSLTNSPNILALGSLNASYVSDSWVHNLQGLTLAEAWTIDTKIDDGRAQTGRMYGYTNDGTCIDNGTDYYSLATDGADTAAQCILEFFL